MTNHKCIVYTSGLRFEVRLEVKDGDMPFTLSPNVSAPMTEAEARAIIAQKRSNTL